ncbi:MAG TPA: DUF4236 domain-containing protein [Micromonosporaceae bacterium]
MGFSIKLAPGVRVRASSRGIRTSIGPRAARVHIGGGRTGFSTGVGPVGFYTSLGGRRSSRSQRAGGMSAGAYQRQLAAQQRQAAQAQKVEEARRLAEVFLHILRLHHAEFAPAQPPVAPPPPQPDSARIHRYYEQHALAGISLFNRAERKQAKQRAAGWAAAEIQRRTAELRQQQAQWQQQLDQRWRELCGNDPQVVIETLDEAFEDNEAPSAAIDVDGDEVSLVVLLPGMEQVVPERMPGQTAAGNLSLRKLTQRERGDYYKHFVCGQVLVTVREALAVAPGIGSARVVALRNDGHDAYGKPHVSCLLAATFHRTALAGIQWQSADAVEIVNTVATERVWNQYRGNGRFEPINLTREPDLAALIQAVDLDELVVSG